MKAQRLVSPTNIGILSSEGKWVDISIDIWYNRNVRYNLNIVRKYKKGKYE